MKSEFFELKEAAMERWRRGDPRGWAEISADDVVYIDLLPTASKTAICSPGISKINKLTPKILIKDRMVQIHQENIPEKEKAVKW